MSGYALALFARGQEMAAERGLILVDTKYEFGTDGDGRIVLADEIHTPDSSRYWIAAATRRASKPASGRKASTRISCAPGSPSAAIPTRTRSPKSRRELIERPRRST